MAIASRRIWRTGKPALLTSSGLNWTGRFRSLVAQIKELPANSIIIDGEVVVPNEMGIADFSLLQAELAAGHSARMLYYAFDLLFLDGFDLRAAPLIERRRVLAELLPAPCEMCAAQRLPWSGCTARHGVGQPALAGRCAQVSVRKISRSDPRRHLVRCCPRQDRTPRHRHLVTSHAAPARSSTRAHAPRQPVGRAPLFRNRSGRPYSKDTLGDDFRAVRIMVVRRRRVTPARRLPPLRHR